MCGSCGFVEPEGVPPGLVRTAYRNRPNAGGDPKIRVILRFLTWPQRLLS